MPSQSQILATPLPVM